MKYKRRCGSWTCVVTLPDRSQRRLTARTKMELDREVTALKDSITKNTYSIGGRITVEHLAQQWFESISVRISEKTVQRYRSIVALHIVPVLGSLQTAKLRPQDIDAAIVSWRTSKRKDGKNRKNGGVLSARTVAHIFQTLNTMLRFGVKRRILAMNVCDSVDAPRKGRREIPSLDVDGARTLFSAAINTELQHAVTVTIGTGLRRAELLGLQWGDVDFERARVTVVRAWERVAGVSRYKTPKSARSARTISLPAFVLRAFEAQRAIQIDRFLLCGNGKPTALTPIFDRPDVPGEPYNPATFSSKYARLAKAAGLPVTFHGLRHSFGSLSLAAGADLKTISSAMGHSTIGVTADTYLHVIDSLGRENARRLDDLFNPRIEPRA